MAHRLKTRAGRKLYALRKQIPEPVFGIIKSVMGFRQFLLRGIDKVRGEWRLVTMAWNLKRMFVLSAAVRRDAVFASNPGLGPTGMNAMATWGTVQALNLRSMATTGRFRGRADGQLKTRVRRAAEAVTTSTRLRNGARRGDRWAAMRSRQPLTTRCGRRLHGGELAAGQHSSARASRMTRIKPPSASDLPATLNDRPPRPA